LLGVTCGDSPARRLYTSAGFKPVGRVEPLRPMSELMVQNILSGANSLNSPLWHQRGELWEFAPDNPDDLATIRARPDWDVLDGYWGERAELVLDQTRRWDKTRVQPTDAIRVQGPTGVWLRPITDTDEGLPR